MTEQEEKKEWFLKRFGKAVREVMYGMAAHDTARFALKTRGGCFGKGTSRMRLHKGCGSAGGERLTHNDSNCL